VNCFAELMVESLHLGAYVDNSIGAEGTKALSDAVKDNIMLTSLSLNLQRA
jgi:hypothetical protein